MLFVKIFCIKYADTVRLLEFFSCSDYFHVSWSIDSYGKVHFKAFSTHLHFQFSGLSNACFVFIIGSTEGNSRNGTRYCIAVRLDIMVKIMIQFLKYHLKWDGQN